MTLPYHVVIRGIHAMNLMTFYTPLRWEVWLLLSEDENYHITGLDLSTLLPVQNTIAPISRIALPNIQAVCVKSI